ncbi:GIY-YIG nuclease family protein [Candidatus Micrarchaeota archaeon]|nr:GIY-YIG nuclease family protein [Candidatus Micrarchaeota archaeon]
MTMEFVSYDDKNVASLVEKYGVYALATGIQNSNQVRVFYVGSGNIGERLSYHLSDSEENDGIKDRVRKYVCYFWHEEVPGGKEKREVREAELIEHYKKQGKAECNKTIPVHE